LGISCARNLGGRVLFTKPRLFALSSVMNKLTGTAICLLTFVYALFSVHAAIAATPSALTSADWSVNAAHSLVKEPPSRKDVEKLLGLSDSPTSGSTLCSFTFADLRRADTLSLVAAFDSSGRGFCNDIEIVDRTAFGFAFADLSSAEIGQGIDVSKLIKDIAGDGRLELVVEMEVGGYQGGVHCGLEWPVIFAWTGSSYADVSAQFKGFYRQSLQELTPAACSVANTYAGTQTALHGRRPAVRGWRTTTEGADSDYPAADVRIFRSRAY
jgi:hypothetical protein